MSNFLQTLNRMNVSGEQSTYNGDRCDIDDFLDLRFRLQRVNVFGLAKDGANRFRAPNTR